MKPTENLVQDPLEETTRIQRYKIIIYVLGLKSDIFNHVTPPMYFTSFVIFIFPLRWSYGLNYK